MKKTIYIVTSGDYSDYSINAVFDSKELAQAFIDAYDQDSYITFDIEEYELNRDVDKLKKGYKSYFVRMSINGDALEVRQSGHPNIGWSYGFDVRNNLIKSVYAKDESHAVKITNELRTSLLASNQYRK